MTAVRRAAKSRNAARKPSATRRKPATKAKPAAPKAKTAAPKAKSIAPKAKTIAPKAKTAAPKAKTIAPKAKTAAPKAKTAAPKAKPATRASRPRSAPASGAPRSIRELMVYALWIELDATERYRELADAMEMHNNRGVEELFRKMAVIEGKHAEKIMKQMGWTSVPPLPSGPAPWPGYEGPESAAHDEVHYLMQPYHALEVALACEERALRFFENLVRVARVPEVRAAATEMRDEEREHVGLVRAWMAKVARPDDGWADDPDPPRYHD